MIRTILSALAVTLSCASPALAELMTLRDSAAVGKTEWDLDRFMEMIMDQDYEAIHKLIKEDNGAFNQATRDVYVYFDAIDSGNARIRVPGSNNSYYTRKYNLSTP